MSRDFQHSFLTHQSTPFGPLTHFLYKMVQHGFDFAELFEFSRNPAESMHDYNREVNLLQHCRVRDENIVQVSGCFSRVNKLKYFYRITSIIGEQIFSKKWGFTRIKIMWSNIAMQIFSNLFVRGPYRGGWWNKIEGKKSRDTLPLGHKTKQILLQGRSSFI